MRFLSIFTVALGLLWPVPAEARDIEQWFVVELQGQPTGWMMQAQAEKAGQIATTSRTQLKVARGPASIAIAIDTRFVETTDGKPISAKAVTDMSMLSQSVEWRFTDAGIEATNTGPDGARRQTHPPVQGDWLPPAAAAGHIKQQMQAGQKTITYRTLDPMTGAQAYQVTMKVLGDETIEAFGKTVPATKVSIAMSHMPGVKSIGYVDERGWPLRATTDMGGMSMTIIAADKALATADRKPAELMNATLIKPDKPIANPRELKAATFIIKSKAGELADIPQTAVQQVQRRDEQSARISIDLTRPAKADGPVAVPKVEHSSMIDGQDAAVMKLARRVLATAGPMARAAPRAEALRRFVHEHVQKKDLSVGFASAGEVARTQQGDCTEHAVLLAAMLRAAGMPSRTASGLVYVDEALGHREIFGYHMWTQAWIDGRWVDLDATLGSDTPFDATHITFATSDMADGQWTNDMVTLAPLLGGLKIEVQRTGDGE